MDYSLCFKQVYSLLLHHKLRSESNFDVTWLSAEWIVVLNWNLTLIYLSSLVEASFGRYKAKIPLHLKGWREATG
jgi:hypothetical protein